MARQATDTFVAILKDGSERLVTKGEVFPDGHELVKRDADGSGMLFRVLDLGDDDAPKSAPETPPPPVKASAARGGKAS